MYPKAVYIDVKILLAKKNDIKNPTIPKIALWLESFKTKPKNSCVIDGKNSWAIFKKYSAFRLNTYEINTVKTINRGTKDIRVKKVIAAAW